MTSAGCYDDGQASRVLGPYDDASRVRVRATIRRGQGPGQRTRPRVVCDGVDGPGRRACRLTEKEELRGPLLVRDYHRWPARREINYPYLLYRYEVDTCIILLLFDSDYAGRKTLANFEAENAARTPSRKPWSALLSASG